MSGNEVAHDPLPVPSTSRQLRPYRSRATSRTTSRSTNSSRASSVAQSVSANNDGPSEAGPSNLASSSYTATADNGHGSGAPSLPMGEDTMMAGLTNLMGPSSGDVSQAESSSRPRGLKRNEPVLTGPSSPGRARKRRRVSSEGIGVDTARDLPPTRGITPEIIDLSEGDPDEDVLRMISESESTAGPALSSSLFPGPSSSRVPLPYARAEEPIDVDSFSAEPTPPAPASSSSSSKSKLPAPTLPVAPPLSTAPDPPPTIEPLSAFNCPICFCPPTHATLTPCGHVCCGECLFTAVKTALARTGGVMMNDARCPVCRASLPGWDGKGGGVIGLKPRTVLRWKAHRHLVIAFNTGPDLTARATLHGSAIIPAGASYHLGVMGEVDGPVQIQKFLRSEMDIPLFFSSVTPQ
ncbi:hypothetical protein GLOTRDRAFT_94341 [Gloeophyllum trabeum ATCC 11539]|uniref:RING-type domain-containing protein n=1 Tax=Gloeophyllum trabeum (strain ATCC 11539 / FP-39264 / Madison 617) TaxID=670483 RepID=S7Q2Z7_GLOTA|nr:uncharacterized protein GLOTRDRAFT_94341 [Gloeophyllum trabeum ATCC 11539]EPQ53917.1 hypothetical protein GLOTRDRAFT_94341 [Gloeophyllum trabeum ATCC 11539]